MDNSKRPLNKRQEKFCRLLVLQDENGTPRSRVEAYMAAYPAAKSPHTAVYSACKLMRDPRIRSRIEELTSETYDRCLERDLPLREVITHIRALLADDKHPAARIAGVKLALGLHDKYAPKPPEDGHAARFAKMTDAELMAEGKRLFGVR